MMPPGASGYRPRSPSRDRDDHGHSNTEPRQKKSKTTSMEVGNSSSTQSSNNIYNILHRDAEDTVPAQPSSSNPPRNVRNRLPPIVIQGLKRSEIVNILQSLKINKNQATIWPTSHGDKVYIDNIEQYKLLRTHLATKKVQFFSHPLDEERIDKFVLYGLHEDTRIDEINEALSNVNIAPVKIVRMEIRKRRFDGHITFLLHFKKPDNITLQKLNKVRSIGYLKVRFQSYIYKARTPICPRCLNPGHGSTFCGLNPRCVRCGANHESSSCPELTTTEGQKAKIPQDKVRCANCGGGHTANYVGCPKIQEYKSIQNKIRKQHKPAYSQPHPIYNKASSSAFKPANITRNFDISSQPSPTHQSKHHSQQHNTSWASIVSSSNEILSTAQLTNLFQEMISQIKHCRTKSEQIMALFQIVVTLINNDAMP